ncbi:SEL1-like repeat protein [Sulfurimonas sp.]|uniref:SEL1-like repeat protein n=2 Tax=Sulfurimonas sp. TaxID=2022749 RepID=UPI003D14A098
MIKTVIKKKIQIILTLSLLATTLVAKVNLDHIDIDSFLNELQPKPTVKLCKDHAQTLDDYIGCLEKNANDNPTVANINFLAGIYASYQMYDKAIKTYEINVAKGDKEATYYLAGIYNEALQQHDKALPYFQMIKEYKDATCQIGGIKAIVKKESWFEFMDERKAKKRTFAFYDNEIKNGNIKAYGCKGLYYNKFEEYKKAEQTFLEGLKQGDSQNLFYLANLYDHYIYDAKKYIHYYEESYKAGNMQAAHNLGATYERSEFKKAIKWYMLSAKSGDLKSLYNIGYVFRINGDGEKAVKVYKKVGELGLPAGNKGVWVYYSKAKEFQKGIEYLTHCTQTGHKECARYLARIYSEDLKEYDKAIEWHIKGYTMGDAESAFDLGLLYDLTLNDNDKAIEWYKKAAALGDVKATYNIGFVYEKELRNQEEALKWYKKAYKLNKEEGSAQMKIEKKLKNLGAL